MAGHILKQLTNKLSLACLIGISLFFMSPQFGEAVTEQEAELQSEIMAFYESAQYKKALPFALKMLELKKDIYGVEHLEVATILNNIGDIHFKDKNYSDAEVNYLRALKLSQKLLGTDHLQVALNMHSLGDVYRESGVFSRSEKFYQLAIRIRENALGADDQYVANSLNNLAELYKNEKLYKKAEPLYLRSLKIYEGALEPGHRHTAIVLNNLSSLYQIRGEYSKAIPFYERLIKMSEQRPFIGRHGGVGSPHTVNYPKVVALHNLDGDEESSGSIMAIFEADSFDNVDPEGYEVLHSSISGNRNQDPLQNYAALGTTIHEQKMDFISYKEKAAEVKKEQVASLGSSAKKIELDEVNLKPVLKGLYRETLTVNPQAAVNESKSLSKEPENTKPTVSRPSGEVGKRRKSIQNDENYKVRYKNNRNAAKEAAEYAREEASEQAKENQQEAKETAKEAKKAAKQVAKEAKVAAKEAAKEAKKAAKETAKQAKKEAAKEAKKAAKAAVKEAKKAAKEIAKEAKKAAKEAAKETAKEAAKKAKKGKG